MKSFFRKLNWLAQRRRKEDELREELDFHLQEETEELEADGLAAESARWAARRGLGNLTLLQESTRAAWGWTVLSQLAQDLRYAFRTMVANRLFTSLAVMSLGLGIGANTAIYSFMDSILLRTLPVSEPSRLVIFNWHANATRDLTVENWSGSTWETSKYALETGIFPYPAFELLQQRSAPYATLFAYCPARTLNVVIQRHADLAAGEYVSGDYFRVLGVPPADGRLIIPDDDRIGAPLVVVISQAFSEKRFGPGAKAAGSSIIIDNLPFTVIGVTPPGFFGVDPAAVPDVFLPLHTNVALQAERLFGFRAAGYLEENRYWIEVMGRLRPGVSLQQTQAALAPIFHQWVAGTVKTPRQVAHLPELELKEGAGGLSNLRRQYSQPLYVLLTLVGLILALACANVANLLLARAAARRREMALRLSVGASRFRVVRQLLTESVLLASLGGLLGIGLAIFGIRFLETTFAVQASLNWRVLAVAVLLSFLTGILFGLAPALQSTSVDVMPALKEARAGNARGRAGLGRALVVAQIAISLLMLVAAGLFVRTLSNLQSVELGFTREHVLLFQLDARKAGHKDPEIAAFYGDLRQRFSAIPGVRAASLSSESLIDAGSGVPIYTPGGQPDHDTRFLTAGPGFFTTMQIPILVGREIEERDHAGSPPVAVINQQFAKITFGDRNPIGQHLSLWTGEHTTRDMEIVGVSRNARYGGLKEQVRPVVYFPYDQGFPQPEEMVYELRTAGDPLVYVNDIRDIVHQADPRVPLSNIRTQAADIDQTIYQEITLAKLGTALAMLALVIACVGLYGTVSYNVARRTGEIGIRMALGAQRGGLVWMVLREVLAVAAIGIAIGIPIALAASKFVASFLFGLKPTDPWALAMAVVTLLAAALLAGYLPAQKASRIDPMMALRHD